MREDLEWAPPQSQAPVNPALLGIAARLDRAKEQILNLEEAIREFREQHPHVAGTNLDPETEQLSYTVEQEPVPARLSVIAGEVLFLLRSSLDHLVAQLLIRITDPSKIDKILHTSAFPICETRKCLDSFKWETKIPGMAPEVRAAITECQPCNRPDGPPEDHPLAILNRLHNRDKHRLLMVFVNRIDVSSTTIQISGKGVLKELHFSDSATISTQLSAPLAHGFVTLGPGSGVEMESKFSVEVAFKEVGTRKGEPVVPTLEHLLLYVRKLTDDVGGRFL